MRRNFCPPSQKDSGSRGIRGDEAPSGEVALRMIAADSPQMVGLNIMMPGMS